MMKTAERHNIQKMNREIKFRGKRLNSNEWVEGFCIKNPDIPVGQDEHEVLISDGYECASVVPSTVGQFTGLRDKNDREVYEGDIINLGRLFGVGLVVFEDMSFGIKRRVGIWNKTTSDYVNCKWADSLEYFNAETINGSEVIGSIHDNHELFKN